MPVKRLKEFLDNRGVKYAVISHSPAFTAQEIAASAHIPGREIAKTVMFKADGKLTMAVLPASYKIDFAQLRNALKAKEVVLAAEEEFAQLFPDCEAGAMPPFGELYGLDVVVGLSLTADKEIAFNAGNHRELVLMAYEDFAELVKPKVAKFTLKRD